MIYVSMIHVIMYTMFGLPDITVITVGGAFIIIVALLLVWAFIFKEAS